MTAEYNTIMSSTIDTYETKIITLNEDKALETEKLVSNHKAFVDDLTTTHKNEMNTLINDNSRRHHLLVQRIYQSSAAVLSRILTRCLTRKALKKLQQPVKETLQNKMNTQLRHLTKSYDEQISQLMTEKVTLQQQYYERLNESITKETKSLTESFTVCQHQLIESHQKDVFQLTKRLVCLKLSQLYDKCNGVNVTLRSFHRWKQSIFVLQLEDRLKAAKTEVEAMQEKVCETDVVIDALEVDIYREMRRIVPKFVAPYLPIKLSNYIDSIPNSTSTAMDRRFVPPDSKQEKEWVIHMSSELRQVALKNLRLYQTMKCLNKKTSSSTDEISQSFLVDEFSIQERIEDINEEVTKVMQLLETHKSCYYHIISKEERESAGTQYGAIVERL
jgi:hypothetical protein